ncbi:MAG TPA: rhamnogalacturonan lyase [Sedimentisphaerales bacterium]|nr:rhamnogalacturonan lyase [Sedimentisphaerales bacterium]
MMENLGRGVIAINRGDGSVYIGWRLLGTDPEEIAFNLYRKTGDGRPVRLNASPITETTDFVDSGAQLDQPNAYFVRPVLNRREYAPSKPYVLAANSPAVQYIEIPLQTPEGYFPNDASVGDLDGDGEYEIVIHMAGRGRDSAQTGLTDEVVLDAYKLDGTHMWRISLGRNIRAGAHYTQFMVYDLDGDGRAEVVCKTADGTMDGPGNIIGNPDADYTDMDPTSRSYGRIITGPEYLTVFDGLTGAALATTDYLPPRGNVSDWGDSHGNRLGRYLACIAYLDGVRPSVVMCRGYYERATLAAWNWRDGQLTHLWTFDSDDGTPGNEKYRGQGNHNLTVGDVDGDGRDEIIYGACAIDDDGTGLYSTGLGHGDAIHMSDMDPSRPGLEVWQPHEPPGPASAGEFRDARTGEMIWGIPANRDIGRGLAADIDPRHHGYELWTSGTQGIYDVNGIGITGAVPSMNFAIWWDDDLLRELLDRNSIRKWDWERGVEVPIFYADGCTSINGTKATPSLSADILGDWREEVIFPTLDGQALRIFTTTIPSRHRIYTLMHDPQYRLAIAWQNVAYNQPPHPGFFLGHGMEKPPRPNIVTSLEQLKSRQR